MKRMYLICALVLALSILCAACGQKTVFDPQPVAPSANLTQDASGNPSADASEVPTENATSADMSEKAGETAQQGAEVTNPQKTTTTAVEAGETTTAKADETTKAGETTTKPAGTTKAGATTTKAGETTTKSAATTKAGASTTKADTTAATGSGTTQAPKPVAGNAVHGTMSYLNPADKAVSSLSAKDLEKYGVTGSKATEILRNPNEWALYTIRMDFRNDEDVPITLYYLDVTNNGTNDVFVRGDFSAEIGLGPGSSENELFNVLAKASDAESAVLGKLGRLSMRVQYAATPEDDEATPNFVYSKVN